MLNFGVIGTGYFGKNYLRLLKEFPEVSLAATATNERDANELISRQDIACVIIASPASTHFRYIVKALESKKHVLVEKPMIIPGDDIATVSEAVNRSGRIFMVGHQYLYNDYVILLKKELEKAALGDIRYIFAEHFYFGPVRFDVGCFWETAVHELAMIDYMFSPGSIKNVAAMATAFTEDGRDDFSSVSILFEKTLTVSLITSWFAPEKIRRMTIAGDKGFVLFDDVAVKDKLKFYFAPYPKKPIAGASYFFDRSDCDVRIPQINAGEPLRNELAHFIECVRSGKTPRTDITHGIRTIEMLQKIQSVL